jgi:hypothetical protein
MKTPRLYPDFNVSENVIFFALSSARMKATLRELSARKTVTFRPCDVLDGNRALSLNENDRDAEFTIQRIEERDIPEKYGVLEFDPNEVPLLFWRSDDPANVQFAVLGAR